MVLFLEKPLLFPPCKLGRGLGRVPFAKKSAHMRAKMTKFIIEKNIPVRSAKNGGSKGKSKYPIFEMEVGDSFFSEDRRLGCRAAGFGKTTGYKFSSSVEGSGVRIWRVA